MDVRYIQASRDSSVPSHSKEIEAIVQDGCEWARKGASPLGLSQVPNSHIRPNRPQTYGRKGITGYGKKSVRSIAELMERRYGRRCLGFLTLTLPPMSKSEQEAVAKGWGRAVNRLHQWLGRRQKQVGLPSLSCGVTEVQPRRSKNDALGALHLHIVYLGKRNRYQNWAFSCCEIRAWWLSQLSRMINRKVVSRSIENVKVVRHSASGYIGKYMSKGGKELARVVHEGGWECLPRQWWSATKNAKEWLKKEKFKGEKTGGILECLIDSYFAMTEPKFCGFLQCHHIDIDGRQILAGYSGRLSRGVAEDLRSMLKCA